MQAYAQADMLACAHVHVCVHMRCAHKLVPLLRERLGAAVKAAHDKFTDL